jgi:branched-chain amino acid transport system ATP-binding protein
MGGALGIEDLHVNYGRIVAVSGVSMHVDPGQLVAVVGANGAGKSSFLKSIAGLVPPTSGRILVDEDDITHSRPWQRVKRGVSLVPEGRLVFPELSIDGNLDMGAYTVGSRSAREAAREKVFDLFPRLRERRKTNHAGVLSGGEQQMVAIGRALMVNPDVLLLDEPTLGLAPMVRSQVMDVVGNLAADGTTVVLVEQNARLAFRFATYAHVFQSGRIVASGTPQELSEGTLLRDAYLEHVPVAEQEGKVE